MSSNRVTSSLPVRSYGIKGDLPKMLDRLRSLENRTEEAHATLKELERQRTELPRTLADAERDALLADKDGPDDGADRIAELDAALEAAQARFEGARQAVHETRRQIEADLRTNGADYRATVREQAAQRRDDALDALADATEALTSYLDAAAVTAALAPVPGTSIGGVIDTDGQRRPRMQTYRGHDVARTLAQARQQLAGIDLSDRALGIGPAADTDTGGGTLRVAG